MPKIIYPINIGDVFGRLTVREVLKERGTYYRCECECGNDHRVRKDALYTGKQVSCGCYLRELTRSRFQTHGESQNRTVEYDTWAHMLRRCYTPTTKGFEDYGGRGITVCDRWRYTYENFLADMGRRPSSRHSLDRLNNNGNYEPGNCEWRTSKEQGNNTRRNHYITFQGETLTATQWQERLGWGRGTIPRRIKSGWSVEQTLTTPPRVAPVNNLCAACQVRPIERGWKCRPCWLKRNAEVMKQIRQRRREQNQVSAHKPDSGRSRHRPGKQN